MVHGQPLGTTAQDEPLALSVGGGAVKLAIGVNVFLGVFVAVIVTVGLIPINGQSHPDISVAAGIPLVLFAVFLFFATGRSGTVTSDSLILRASRISKRRAIPLADIVAVGMVYTIQPRLNGWKSYVWRAADKPVGLPIGLCMGYPPAKYEAGDNLGSTRQGELCRELFRRVELLQGSSGPAAKDRETQRHGLQSHEKAYWSANPAVPGIHPLA
ncbi:MAG: hypothetical protein ACYCTI_02920 [Acidimicrobiales bacterium]